MTATATFVLELTAEELRLVTNALESFMSDFGHDEAVIHRTLRGILAKAHAASALATVSTTSTVTQ